MLAGLVLRVIGLDEGMWFDEIATLVNYIRLPAMEIIRHYETLNNHMLYSLLAHFSVEWFGESAWSVRLPAVLFGVATIPAAYYLGRQITVRREAFLASAFLTLNYHHVWFSQDARGYTGLVLGAVLLSIIFIRLILRESPGFRSVLAYAVIAALATWIHLTAALVVIAHGIILLALIFGSSRKQKSDFRPAAVQAMVMAAMFSLALYSPILVELAAQIFGTEEVPEILTVWNTTGWVLEEFMRAAIKSLPGGWPLALLAALAMVAGIWSYLRQGIFVSGILFLPSLVTTFFIVSFMGLLFPRFLFGSVVFFLLTAVRGGFVLSRFALPMFTVRQVTIIGLIFALATVVMLPGVWKPKQDFAAAAEFINKQHVPGDAVACFQTTHMGLHRYLGMKCERALSVAGLIELEKTHSRTWLVYAFPIHFQGALPDVWMKVQNDYSLVTKIGGTVGGGDIIIMLKINRESEQ
jgi:uncharacterized membrane protein